MPIPGNRGRAGGVFTVFHWDSGSGEKVIAFADEVRVTSVQPVAPPGILQPMNALRPVEIVMSGAHGAGTIVLVLTELYNQAVWQRLSGLANSNDIADISRTIAAMNNGIKISKYVNPPAGVGGSAFDTGSYLETFHECVVTRVGDDEQIRVDTVLLTKEVELMFAYSRKHWINSPRDASRIFA